MSEEIRQPNEKLNSHSCPLCSQSYRLAENLIKHVETVHLKEPVINIFKCDNCSKIFPCKSYLKRHTKRHDGQTRKPTNSQKSPRPKKQELFNATTHAATVQSLEKEPLTEHSTEGAGKVGKKCESFQVQRGNSVPGKTSLSCAKCSKTFDYKSTLERHLRNAHNPGSRKLKKEEDVTAKTQQRVQRISLRKKSSTVSLSASSRKLRSNSKGVVATNDTPMVVIPISPEKQTAVPKTFPVALQGVKDCQVLLRRLPINLVNASIIRSAKPWIKEIEVETFDDDDEGMLACSSNRTAYTLDERQNVWTRSRSTRYV